MTTRYVCQSTGSAMQTVFDAKAGAQVPVAAHTSTLQPAEGETGHPLTIVQLGGAPPFVLGRTYAIAITEAPGA